MKIIAILMYLISFATCAINGQAIKGSILNNSDTSKVYLFYLHGQIEIKNGKGFSQYFGVYEYQNILDTFSRYGFNVISEPRPINVDDSIFSVKVSKQIDTLLKAGINPAKIVVVGASLGAYITIDVAMRLKNLNIKYAILGMCLPDTYKSYIGKEICGTFFSIYESSDPHCSCLKLFIDRHCVKSVQEIKLSMNNSHAFLYKPYKEWVYPLVDWIIKTK